MRGTFSPARHSRPIRAAGSRRMAAGEFTPGIEEQFLLVHPRSRREPRVVC